MIIESQSEPTTTTIASTRSGHGAGLSAKSIAVRLFVTCWLIYSLHLATNTVREIYLALAIGDHLSFRVDDYANMHPDLFEKPGYGWHIGANPGVSMVAALPYAAARPLIDRVVDRVNESRRASGQAEPPAYDSPWPMAQEFYRESWSRGYDIKFGLAAIVMQSFCMAPSSAAAVVLIFLLLAHLLRSRNAALWLSLLYAFGTPVFFRTGYLNHNLMLGHIAFAGFLLMWNPWEWSRPSSRIRYLLGGLCGGTAVLFDYSGVVLLLVLFAYAVIRQLQIAGWSEAVRHGVSYIIGSAGPIFLLWFYQWQSFGNPFLPGQHWMPPVKWIDQGYQGFSLPQLDLLLTLAFDYRFGLFVTGPIFLLALYWFVSRKKGEAGLPRLEAGTMLAVFLALLVFFSCVNYTRLQFNTGIRYLAPVFPFLFVPAALGLMRLPLVWRYFIGVACVAEAWCLAMHRDVERGLGVLDPILSVFLGGFRLPVLTVLSRMKGLFTEHLAFGVSPLPLLVITGMILYGIWSSRLWGSRSKDSGGA